MGGNHMRLMVIIKNGGFDYQVLLAFIRVNKISMQLGAALKDS